jgi:hypothetical protein
MVIYYIPIKQMSISVNKSILGIRRIIAFPIAATTFFIPPLILKFIVEPLMESHQNVVIIINLFESALGCWLYLNTGIEIWGIKYRIHACVAFSLLLAVFSGLSLAGINDKGYPTWYVVDEILSFIAVIVTLFWGCMHFVVEALHLMAHDLERETKDENY